MLRIVGRRADGYHELQTVFQFLDFGDQLHVEATRDRSVVRVAGAPEVAAEDDLAVRAARLLQAETGCDRGVRIRVDKRLPQGGGLGGGSSDAATILVVLNRLWGLHLDDAELARLGLRLGADVPVFLFGRAAWGEGVGERLVPTELPEPWYVVICPACHVSTARVFQDPELTRNSPRLTIRDFIAGEHGNDCLPVVVARYPAVAAALQWLGRYAEARLTGTGGCVFAAFDSAAAAQRVLEARPAHLAGFVARAANESPLRRRLRQTEGLD
jgi:4-diphosphocytidyl-2-C-methyl-D-erythritol kinase